MTIRDVAVVIDRQQRHVTPGLKQGKDLIQVAGITGNEQLLFDIRGEVDIPVLPTDWMLIQGGETFSIGDGSPCLEDNPRLRHPIRFMLNEQQLGEGLALQHAKITGAEIKRLAQDTSPCSSLVADLDGLADEPIEDHQRLIVQPRDQFIIIHKEECDPHPHTVQVTIDGRHVELLTGSYRVTDLKQKLGVPADYELELVEHGQFSPVADDSSFCLTKAETFISHVRTGASS